MIVSADRKRAREWLPAPSLEEKAAFLRTPSLYGSSAATVEMRETNMSLVFLAGDFVFKLKKPVRLSYLDFSTLTKRRIACLAEVELNRRLAPSVYLGAVPLCISSDGLAIDGNGSAVDWLVKMRRLDHRRMLDSLIAKNQARRRHADDLASTLASFYHSAKPVFLQPDEFLKRWKVHLQQNRTVLLNPRLKVAQGLVRYLDTTLQEFLSKRGDILLSRLRHRHIVDGHGDLRPEHIWLNDQVRIIDCLEFNAALRAIDPLEEIAYLDLECEHLGAKDFGRYVCARIMDALHDDPPFSLFCFYRCYRAMLRARLSIAHLLAPSPRTPEKWRPNALSYLEIAATDAKQLAMAIRKPEDLKKAYSHGGAQWLPREAERKKEPRPFPSSVPA
jgi:aminoglycoside phosphotransferase family enzyme